MPFQKGNKFACRKDKLSKEEVLLRKRMLAREYRKTHSYDPKKRRRDYLKHKFKMISEFVAAGKKGR